MNALNTIVLTNELLINKEFLTRKLENLYCGKKGSYLIHLEWSQLSALELIFDSIIREHGVREVEFDYQIEGQEEIPLKKLG